MSESELSSYVDWVFWPSFLAVILATGFLFTITTTLGKVFSSFIGLIIFVISITTLATISGCFETCSGKIDDEIGALIGGIINLWYALSVFVLYASVSYNKQRQGDA